MHADIGLLPALRSLRHLFLSNLLARSHPRGQPRQDTDQAQIAISKKGRKGRKGGKIQVALAQFCCGHFEC
jgi:hypothetical protein